ncbi:hypothetical protein BDZ89DRAFT_1146082 [Hymenopellis radicata]|nr:hypothetical protein BDZ89DRAFT_1146082 [Hymenopellis radicata]
MPRYIWDSERKHRARAGGWEGSLTRTQEEALRYSSTLYITLKDEYYPWPNIGPGSIAGIYSPAVLVHRDDLDQNLTKNSPPKHVSSAPY